MHSINSLNNSLNSHSSDQQSAQPIHPPSLNQAPAPSDSAVIASNQGVPRAVRKSQQRTPHQNVQNHYHYQGYQGNHAPPSVASQARSFDPMQSSNIPLVNQRQSYPRHKAHAQHVAPQNLIVSQFSSQNALPLQPPVPSAKTVIDIFTADDQLYVQNKVKALQGVMQEYHLTPAAVKKILFELYEGCMQLELKAHQKHKHFNQKVGILHCLLYIDSDDVEKFSKDLLAKIPAHPAFVQDIHEVTLRNNPKQYRLLAQWQLQQWMMKGDNSFSADLMMTALFHQNAALGLIVWTQIIIDLFDSITSLMEQQHQLLQKLINDAHSNDNLVSEIERYLELLQQQEDEMLFCVKLIACKSNLFQDLAQLMPYPCLNPINKEMQRRNDLQHAVQNNDISSIEDIQMKTIEWLQKHQKQRKQWLTCQENINSVVDAQKKRSQAVQQQQMIQNPQSSQSQPLSLLDSYNFGEMVILMVTPDNLLLQQGLGMLTQCKTAMKNLKALIQDPLSINFSYPLNSANH